MWDIIRRFFVRIQLSSIRKGINRILNNIGITDLVFLRKLKNYHWIITHENQSSGEILYSFFDLDTFAPTFDIVMFLIMTDVERIRHGLSEVTVIIVPGKERGHSKDYTVYREKETEKKIVNVDELNWRIRQILIPCCSLLPSCKQVIICSSRKNAFLFQKKISKWIFPKGYSVLSPVSLWKDYYKNVDIGDNALQPTIVPSDQALAYVDRWLSQFTKDKKCISISFRECTYEKYRNSNIEEWNRFIHSIDRNAFQVIIVRDTDNAFSPIDIVASSYVSIFNEASWNIELKAALYHRCYLNLFTTNGSGALAWYNKHARFLMFKLLVPGSPYSNIENYLNNALIPGTQPVFFSPYQKFVWDDDTCDIIYREFHAMVNLIEMSIHETY